jgi:16S rRNA pseudouridine516 synthase
VEKVYFAETDGPVTPAHADAFARGLDLGEFTALPARLEPLGNAARVTVREGKFHQVKRMFEKIGHPVITLHRLSFGPLTLGDDLPEGAWREVDTGAVYTGGETVEADAPLECIPVFERV